MFITASVEPAGRIFESLGGIVYNMGPKVKFWLFRTILDLRSTKKTKNENYGKSGMW